jgi:hypothetical protein
VLDPSISDLYLRTLFIPSKPHPAAAPTAEFLSQCIQYHTRARTLPALISQIQAVLSLRNKPNLPATELYSRSTASPLLSRMFCASLAKSVRAFVTPGQVLLLAQDIISSLERAWDAYSTSAKETVADDREGSRKKKKARRSRATDEHNAMASGSDSDAVAFALLARLAAAVLPALLTHSVADDTQDEVAVAVGAALRGFLWTAIERGASADFAGDPRRDPWAAHAMSAASLRLAYALVEAKGLPLEFETKEAFYTVLLETLKRDDLLPELFVEIVSCPYDLPRYT